MKKEYDFTKGKRGPVVAVPKGKTRITIRIDDDVLDWFREQVHAAGGGNYQTMINSALRDFMEHQGEPLEATVRRVIREELAKKSTSGDTSKPAIRGRLKTGHRERCPDVLVGVTG
jgi:hypothetical protein